jgi:hypothetical protein
MRKAAMDDPQLEDMSNSELTAELRFVTGNPKATRADKPSLIRAIRRARNDGHE